MVLRLQMIGENKSDKFAINICITAEKCEVSRAFEFSELEYSNDFSILCT